jgi:hypothetical protein
MAMQSSRRRIGTKLAADKLLKLLVYRIKAPLICRFSAQMKCGGTTSVGNHILELL